MICVLPHEIDALLHAAWTWLQLNAERNAALVVLVTVPKFVSKEDAVMKVDDDEVGVGLVVDGVDALENDKNDECDVERVTLLSAESPMPLAMASAMGSLLPVVICEQAVSSGLFRRVTLSNSDCRKAEKDCDLVEHISVRNTPAE